MTTYQVILRRTLRNPDDNGDVFGSFDTLKVAETCLKNAKNDAKKCGQRVVGSIKTGFRMEPNDGDHYYWMHVRKVYADGSFTDFFT